MRSTCSPTIHSMLPWCAVAVLLAMTGWAGAADDSDLPPADAHGIIIKEKGTTSAVLGFTVRFPPGYSSTAETRWPVLFTLAGTGEQGDGTGATAAGQLYDKTTRHGVLGRIKGGGSWPYPVIVVAPQSLAGWKTNEINSVVDYALANWKVDANRVYLTGLCQGGAATWAYAQNYPGKLAAICPIQASAGPGAPEALIDTRVWAFHSWGDYYINRRNSVNWINGVASVVAGTPVNCLTTYPNTGGDPNVMAATDMTAHFDLASNTWTWFPGKPATAVPLADPGKGVVLTLYASNGHGTWWDVWNGNTDQMWVWLFAQAKTTRAPWSSTAAAIPGVIQAEAFDRGPGGVAWQDSDRANRSGLLRNEGVDVALTSDADGDYDVTELTTGEFLTYTTTCTTAGIYDLALRVSSSSVGRIRVTIDGQDSAGLLQLPATAGAWQTVRVMTTALRTGPHDVRIDVDSGGFSLNWLEFAASTAPSVVVDNTTVGAYSTVGTWPVATSISGFYGTNYAWATATSATSATWTPALPEAAYYQVYIRHPADAARAPSVPVTITSDQGVSYASINQQKDSATWKYLGTFPFTPGLNQGVTITTAGTTKYVVADAVMFLKSYQIPPIDLVVDNRDPVRFTTVGAWQAGSSVPGYYAADYAFNQVTGVGGLSATFRPTLPASGYYKVYAMYAAAASRSQAVPVEVAHAEGVASLSLDQRTGSGWVYLGTWSFPSGTTSSVTLRTDGTTGYVIADAVRFQATTEIPPVDLIIDNTRIDATSQTGMWLPTTSVPGFYGANFASSNATASGGLRREVWNGNPSSLDDFPLAAAPASVSFLSTFEAPTNAADGYCQRVSGYIVAPATGSYTFWIASDDNSALYLSPGIDPAAKVMIANAPGWTNAREWTRHASQRSAAISLVAGQRYYVEARMIEGAGGDNLAVGWARPGQATTQPSEIIGGANISIADGTPGSFANRFTFRPTLPKAGIYEVYVRHPANSTRSPAVPIAISHLDGTANLILDQRSNGGVWRLLGTYRFDAGTAGALTISTTGTTGQVAADAVRFKETNVLPPRDLVIDNLDATQTERVGSWATATTVAGFNAANYHYNTVLGGGSTFSWIPQMDRDGYFEVSIWHPADANRDSAVQVEVVHADGRYGHFLDLTQRGGQWEVLGTFVFLKGSAGRVIMRSDGSSKYLMADAVRFREVDELPEPAPLSLIVDNAWTAFTSKTGAWSIGTSVPGYFAGNYAWCTTPGVGGASFTFTPDLPHPGTYNVWIRHSGSANRAVAVPVDLITPEGTTTTTINQSIDNGVWKPLGTVTVPSGTGTSVRVRTDGTTKYVTADAVWFEEIILAGDG